MSTSGEAQSTSTQLWWQEGREGGREGGGRKGEREGGREREESGAKREGERMLSYFIHLGIYSLDLHATQKFLSDPVIVNPYFVSSGGSKMQSSAPVLVRVVHHLNDL